jgi:hypothetical protein
MRIMRVPLGGGRPEPLVTYPPGVHGGVWPYCASHGRCVVEEVSPKPDVPSVVFALDPMRGKQQELTHLPTGIGTTITADGEHFAYIMPEENGIRNHVRIVSFHGDPPQDIVVKNAARLQALDSFPTGGFLSLDIHEPRRTLLFITTDGSANVLWRPEQLVVGPAIPSPDGKHLAINALTRQSNVWLIDHR